MTVTLCAPVLGLDLENVMEGKKATSTVVAAAAEGGEAHRCGILAGDRIHSIGGKVRRTRAQLGG